MADGLTCTNCASPHREDDIFCESCGFDFLTGSLPEADPPVGQPVAPAGAPSVVLPDAAPPASIAVEIAVDVAYFAVVVTDGELELPDPVPDPQTVQVDGAEAHIGRTSESRNIHPDIDIAALTGDPAVSSRHAVLRRTADGGVTVTDVGSTNGTTVGVLNAPLLAKHAPVTLEAGVPVYVGAWTRITLLAP